MDRFWIFSWEMANRCKKWFR